MSNYNATGLLPNPMTGFGGDGGGTTTTTTSASTNYGGYGGNLLNGAPMPPNAGAGMEDTATQHYVIGDNLRAKAFYDDAIDEFQKAIHIQEPLLGDNSVVVAKTHYALGLCFRATKDYKPSLFHLTKANRHFEWAGLEIERAPNDCVR